MGSEKQSHQNRDSLFKDPGNRDNLDLFYKFLTGTTQGLALCRVVPSERSRLFDLFEHDALNKRILWMNLGDPPLQPIKLQQAIIESEKKYGKKKNIFFIYNFESCFNRLKTTAGDFFQEINLIRDFFMRFDALFVFFMTEETEKIVIRSALDFYDWIISIFIFTPEGEYLTGPTSGISILHLGDIHFITGETPHRENARKHIQEKLLQAINAHKIEYGPPQVVAITGDIAFSAKSHEYRSSQEFLSRLKAALPGNTGFLAVPGNHDVDREQTNKFFSPHRIVQEERIDEFIEDKKDFGNFIAARFKSYREFAQCLNPSLYPSEGDYCWVRRFPGKNVSFLGFNSAWASEGNNDRLNIALGRPQLLAALEKAADTPYRVALMHHPPVNWLRDLEYGQTLKELFANCRLLLHSHVHADNALVLQYPSYNCICLGAHTSYTGGKNGFIGFQFIHAEFSPGNTGVKVWPYIFSGRRLEFIPDRQRWRGQAGKPYFFLEAGRAPGGPGLPPIPEDYRKWIREFHSTLPVEQLARKGEVVLISLPAVYVSLETANPFHRPADERGMEKETKEPPTIDIEELMGRVDCLLLEGRPGMGKTTLIKHLAYTLTHGAGPMSLRGYLPVMVFLKDLWPIYLNGLQDKSTDITFESLLEKYFQLQRCPLSMETVEAYLARHRTLIMLDGMDEVPGASREHLADLVHRFRLRHRNNRFLITGRPYGLQGTVLSSFGGYLSGIRELNGQKSREFISRWFRAVSSKAAEFSKLNPGYLIDGIHQHKHAAIFTGNPLLLTALCIFYLPGGKRIPAQRADLYDRLVENLLYRRFHDPTHPGNVNRAREFLMLAAFTMQTRNISTITLHQALELMKTNTPPLENESPHEYNKRLEELFNRIEAECGLLNRRGGDMVEFIHLAFQQFLAARYMLERNIDYRQYLEDLWWAEVLLMYTGLVNLHMKTRGGTIASELLEREKEPRLQLLGARALGDFQEPKREQAVMKLARERMLGIIENSESLEYRFQAGEILGTLGDPRINAVSPPMLEVEAGEFIRGSGESGEEDEKPARRIYLDAFETAKYPVTNQEFKTFLDDGGYNYEEFWLPGGWTWKDKNQILEPRFWRERKWNGANFPVVGINWYEASAYTRWLSKVSGLIYYLPPEAQWEKAARGGSGLIYPWGSKWREGRCNSRQSQLGRSCPVGIFPADKSPYGCMDMAGNVMEWCSDWYRNDYYKVSPKKNPRGPRSGSFRVIRGGNWFYSPGNCRAACRYRGLPTFRGSGVGFRLCRAL
jgi:formylglycine-generating enzyme required for sulfatase activity/predicted MPP superfamily phosphohydrolase/energy-coupling factor transporter ATP-binding protein EcfA2